MSHVVLLSLWQVSVPSGAAVLGRLVSELEAASVAAVSSALSGVRRTAPVPAAEGGGGPPLSPCSRWKQV